MSFPRYPEYKDSGVEWLGDVPTHWQVDRLKWSMASCRNGIWGEEAQGDSNDIPCVRVADFDRQRLAVSLSDPTIRSVTQKERAGRVLARGDLLIEKSGGGENQPVGCVVLYDDEAPSVCSNFVARIELAKGMSPSYWRYVHAAAYSVRLTVGSINQTSGIQNLDQGRYFDERAPFPPEGEQVGIATFLDRETAKIDALIAEQERLIELLKEKRQAVISHAVTKGLDPDVPMKDSGVEWLGEVPAHWIVISLGRVAITRCDGPFGSGLKSDHYTDEGARVIRLQNIRFGEFDDSDAAFIDLEYAQTELAGHDVLPGDVLVAGLGDERHLVGRACVAPIGLGPALVKADCFRFRLDQARTEPSFVALQLSAGADAEGGRLATGTTRQRIPLSAMSARRLALPPVGEQRSIARYLDRETTTIDCLADEAQGAIRLLRERRAALVSAAVCGKIDVRELST